jgi:antitoxin YefM
MNSITVNEAKQNLDRIIERVIADAEPTVLRSDNGNQIVLISLDESNSWKESVYLLTSPANAAHLRKSLDEARAGKIEEKELIET